MKDTFLDNSQTFSKEEIESRNCIKNKIITVLANGSNDEIKNVYDEIFGGKCLKSKKELKDIFYASYSNYKKNKKRLLKRIINNI